MDQKQDYLVLLKERKISDIVKILEFEIWLVFLLIHKRLCLIQISISFFHLVNVILKDAFYNTDVI